MIPRAPRSRRLVWLPLACLFALTTLGCPTFTPCAIPASAEGAAEWLSGSWVVTSYDGTVDGEITFVGNDVQTTWRNVVLLGSWAHLGSADNTHVIRLTIDEAFENDVRQQYGTMDEVDLELVFATHDHLYALQPDGVWTEWERIPTSP